MSHVIPCAWYVPRSGGLMLRSRWESGGWNLESGREGDPWWEPLSPHSWPPPCQAFLSDGRHEGVEVWCEIGACIIDLSGLGIRREALDGKEG